MSCPIRVATALALTALVACTSNPVAPPSGGAVHDLRFLGQSAFGWERLRAQIAEEVGSLELRDYRRSAIDDAAFAIEQLYAAKGWPFCRVEYRQLDPAESGGARAEFTIEEGPRTELENVSIRGNRSLPSKELLAFVKMPALDGQRYFRRRAVGDALSAISAWYFSQGFLEVETSEPEITFHSQNKRARVALEVREGQRFFLRAIHIEGAPDGTEPDLEHLTDEVYTPPLIAAVRRLVRESLGHHGYPDALVQVKEQRGQAERVELHVDVRPGALVTIRDVRVVGNDKTRSGRIEGALSLGPGDVYDVELERSSFRKLYETGLFTSVRLSLADEGPERDLVVEVEEAPSTELYLEPGYGSYERARLGIGWRESNLFGTGRILNVEGSGSKFVRRAKVDLIDQRLFDSEISANLSLFYSWREEPSFTEEAIGTGVTFSRRLSEYSRGSIGYQFRSTNVLDVEAIGPELARALEDVDVSSIVVGFVRDTRDQLFAPSNGSITRPTVELASSALGSEIGFLRANLRHSRFFSLGEGTVLGLSLRGGVIIPIGDTDTIPLQERYFNGGESTVRSFREDELGALDPGGEPIGGEAFTLLSAELRQNLHGALQGALFFDSGNLQAEYQDFLSFGDLRHAVGVGLRYMLPIGPLRLDLGFNPDPKAGEDDFTIHFSVGMAF